MSRHGEITFPWGDQEYKFRLGYGELRQLQEACDAGPPRIADRLRPYDPINNPHGDNWRIQDIRETIRLGLIGGGMSSHDALVKVTRFVDNIPLIENRFVAYAIIQAAISGATDEMLGKAEELMTAEATTGSRMERSPSEGSTVSAR